MLKTLEAKKKDITYEVIDEADPARLLTNEQNGAEVCSTPV